MFPSKKATVSSHDRAMCVQGDSGLVLTTDPKPRLRWTVELHDRFVDAVQKHLQLRIEAHGKYMQSILERACQTLEAESLVSGSYKGHGDQGVADMGAIKEMGSPMSFPSLQDLHLCGGDQLDLQPQVDGPLDGFYPINDSILGKKRMIWADDLRLQELGSTSACVGPKEEPCCKSEQLQIVPSVIDAAISADPMANVYEGKPVLSMERPGEKQYEGSFKLDRPSPRRASLPMERINPMMAGGGLPQASNRHEAVMVQKTMQTYTTKWWYRQMESRRDRVVIGRCFF
ncbi:hypothetical protein BHE74_00047470 [Ensete ventricosum]|uniref:MYB-CC type transcription factor LHEQLE-containing domain-containing protein n=1 Tax=Ensete ventricosum TaxID=4639 RepID=A0A427B8Q3_ENSVE|nr:hypothetical protein B296_00004982 [Ensete ventricosum]RWW46594.1 hypothetical protein BHE74_00047470 [Ensete ventricosum]